MKIQLKRSNVIDGGAAKKPTAGQMEYGELAVNYSDTDPAVFIKDSNDNIVRIAGKGANGGTELPDSGGGDHQPGTTDDRYVELTGDTMTGPLVLSGDPTADEQASNKKYVDDVAAAAVVDGDAKYVEVAGDNMTGNLTFGTNNITLDATTGTADFTGQVTAGNGSGAPGTSGVGIGDPGYVSIGHFQRASQSCLSIANTSTNTRVFSVNGAGAAEFKGPIQSIPDAASYCYAVGMAETASGGLYMGVSGGADSSLFLGPGGGQGVTVSIFGSTGEAEFAGGITSGVTSQVGYLNVVGNGSAYGYIFASNTNGYTAGLNYRDKASNGAAFIASDASGNDLAKIDWFGGATFVGQITAGDGSGSPSTSGVGIGNQGFVSISHSNRASQNCLSIYDTTIAKEVFSVTGTGAGTFKGQITTGDGSGSTSGVNVGDLGYVSISHSNRTSQNCLAIYDSTNDKEVFSVSGSGTATFKSVDVTQTGSGYTFIGRYSDGVATFSVSDGGEGQFNGRLTAGNSVSAASGTVPYGLTAYNNSSGVNAGAVYAQNYNSAGNAIVVNDGSGTVWSVSATGVQSTRGLFINTEADDDTKYTSTTDSEGVETRVYNGAVLDVKDRLQKSDTALKALKVAAAAASDFAALKSAIATALYDI